MPDASNFNRESDSISTQESTGTTENAVVEPSSDSNVSAAAEAQDDTPSAARSPTAGGASERERKEAAYRDAVRKISTPEFDAEFSAYLAGSGLENWQEARAPSGGQILTEIREKSFQYTIVSLFFLGGRPPATALIALNSEHERLFGRNWFGRLARVFMATLGYSPKGNGAVGMGGRAAMYVKVEGSVSANGEVDE